MSAVTLLCRYFPGSNLTALNCVLPVSRLESVVHLALAPSNMNRFMYRVEGDGCLIAAPNDSQTEVELRSYSPALGSSQLPLSQSVASSRSPTPLPGASQDTPQVSSQDATSLDARGPSQIDTDDKEVVASKTGEQEAPVSEAHHEEGPNGEAPPSEASLLQALYGHDGFSDAGAEATFEAALLNAELHLGGSPACFDSAGDAVSAATFSAVAAAGGIVHYSRTRRQRQFEDDLLNAEPNPAPEPAPERLCSVCLADEVKVVIIWRCPRCCDGD